VTILLACITIGVACFLLAGPVFGRLGRLVRRFEAAADVVLVEMFMFNVTPRMVTVGFLAIVAFCTLVFWMIIPGVVALVVGAGIGIGLPALLVYLMIRRRRAALEVQLLDGLISLANGMRAGLNLGQSLALIEDHGEVPLSQEFGLINREIEHGASIDVALDNASRRLKSHNYRLLFAAMKTTRLRGGNMPDTLDRLGESLREIIRLEEKVKAQTAQGRMSAIFMGLMPLVVIGIYYLIDPPGVEMLFNDAIGQSILAGCLVLNLLGFLWIHKIVSFEI
jgi:tight adherence protein B